MERLLKISEDIQSEFNDGLLYGTSKSSIAMLPSYVPALPDGTGKNKNITPLQSQIHISGLLFWSTTVGFLFKKSNF